MSQNRGYLQIRGIFNDGSDFPRYKGMVFAMARSFGAVELLDGRKKPPDKPEFNLLTAEEAKKRDISKIR